MSNKSRVMSPPELFEKIASLKRGEKFTYYVGFLARDRDVREASYNDAAKLNSTAYLASLLSQHGIITMVTKRIEDETYQYIAIRTGAEFMIPKEVASVVRRLSDLYGKENDHDD